jgi:hypothetical protein
MGEAIRLLKPMSFDEAFKFFHGDTFMGRPYNAAKKDGRAISWTEIIQEYDTTYDTDHEAIKQRLITYG